MPKCDYCDEEFDSEEELHLHWGEEHEDELSSHDKEKVKKAERKQDEQKQNKMRKRKQYAGYALGGALALILIGVVGAQLMNSGGGSATFDSLDDQPMMGEEDAPVTVVEFGDYQCPHCRDFEFNAKPQLKENFIDTGDVKFHYINFPVTGPGASHAAAASECVYQEDPEQFWDFHDAVFQNQDQVTGQMDTDFLMEMARENTEGLDYEGLQSCISNQDTQGEVQSDRELGQQSGVRSTPTVFVNGEQVGDWSYNNLAQKINDALDE